MDDSKHQTKQPASPVGLCEKKLLESVDVRYKNKDELTRTRHKKKLSKKKKKRSKAGRELEVYYKDSESAKEQPEFDEREQEAPESANLQLVEPQSSDAQPLQSGPLDSTFSGAAADEVESDEKQGCIQNSPSAEEEKTTELRKRTRKQHNSRSKIFRTTAIGFGLDKLRGNKTGPWVDHCDSKTLFKSYDCLKLIRCVPRWAHGDAEKKLRTEVASRPFSKRNARLLLPVLDRLLYFFVEKAVRSALARGCVRVTPSILNDVLNDYAERAKFTSISEILDEPVC